MIIVIVILALAVTCLLAVYRHSVRECLALNEYTQFLLLNPHIYADHRAKFEAYLTTTGDRTGMQRGVDALKAVTRMALDGHDKLVLANVGARNAVAQRGRA